MLMYRPTASLSELRMILEERQDEGHFQRRLESSPADLLFLYEIDEFRESLGNWSLNLGSTGGALIKLIGASLLPGICLLIACVRRCINKQEDKKKLHLTLSVHDPIQRSSCGQMCSLCGHRR